MSRARPFPVSKATLGTFTRACVSLVSIFALLVSEAEAQNSTATISSAKDAAAAMGQSLQSSVATTVSSSTAATSVPGYQGSDLTQGDYFNHPDALSSAGANAAATSTAYALTTNPNRPSFDSSTIDLSNAKTVEAAPSSYTGTSTSGSQGNCQALPASAGSSSTYYDSCQIGQTESDKSFTCNVVWQNQGASYHQFTCHTSEWDLFNPNTNATFYWGQVSDCGTFASQSTCTQVAQTKQPSVTQWPVGAGIGMVFTETDTTYQCSTATNYGTGASQSYAINHTSITVVPPAMDAAPGVPGVTDQGQISTYQGSSVDDSDCQSQLGSITCPNGTTLQNGACVGSTAASVTTTCPTGYTLSGSTCTLSQSVNASTTGYSCPSDYTLSGTSCIQTLTQAASPTYSCPNGGTLSGSQCSTISTTPATASYSCPWGTSYSGSCIGTLYGSGCPSPFMGMNLSGAYPVGVTNYLMLCTYQALTTYSCPSGGTLSGTTCTSGGTYAASTSYNCPAGWTLNGSSCTSSTSLPATPTYACPAGYSQSGQTCSETLTLPATPNYSCPTDWTLAGSTCTISSAASVSSYSCDAGWTLSGSTCTLTSSVAATQTLSCPSGGTLSGSSCVTSTTPAASTGMSCTTPVEVCTDSSPTTRMVDGVAVTHDCWAWQRTYQCATLGSANDCATLQAKSNCSFDHEVCLDDACTVKSEVYKCTTPAGASTTSSYSCSGDIYCINGDCTQITRQASPDFANALVAINAMGDATNQLDPNSLTLFGGDATGCHKPLFGLVNCCAGKSSGLITATAGAAALAAGPASALMVGLITPFLVTFMCSSEERELDVKDRMGQCHYVGEYCSEHLLFVCASERKSYCCFQSKLARVIQEQGRAQLGKGWGSPQGPDCSGFTVDEFSRLDLSKMDFSEVYSDFTSAVSVPASIINSVEIQSKISAYYQAHQGS